MDSNQQASREARQSKRALHLYRVCDGGLEAAVARAGGELAGFSAKMSGEDVLVTLRADFPAGRMVSFAGGETLGNSLVKAYREARSDSLKWRADKWVDR